jgi:hypothetical protein
MERRAFLISLLPLAACACSDDFDCGRAPDSAEDRRKQMLECESPTPAPTPVPEPKAVNIEFRVLGDVAFDPGTNGAEIQFGSTQEGTSRILSTLPWFSSTKTYRDSLFIVLNAQATGFGVIQAQIIVNGELFREASASGFNPKVALSGLFSR